jgi:hypothetical protein
MPRSVPAAGSRSTCAPRRSRSRYSCRRVSAANTSSGDGRARTLEISPPACGRGRGRECDREGFRDRSPSPQPPPASGRGRSEARLSAAVIAAVSMTSVSTYADVATPMPPRIALVSVSRVSSTAPDADTEDALRLTEAALRLNGDLGLCLGQVRVQRNAGTLSASFVYDRAVSPRVSIRGRLPAAARRCVETAARAVRLQTPPSGSITIMARFEVRHLALRHRGSNR